MKDLLQQIMLKAYEINKNTEHKVFMYFYGHVNLFELQVHSNGWKESKSADIMLETYLDKRYAKAELQHMLDKLEELEE